MLGSYFACAQLAAAVEHPEHLKAIFAPVVTADLYEIVWRHGLQSSGFIAPWLSAVGVMASKTDKLWASGKLDMVRHVLASDDQPKGSPRLLGFTHTPIAQPSLNTVFSSSRLMLPLLAEQ